jgi:hypothetical protein
MNQGSIYHMEAHTIIQKMLTRIGVKLLSTLQLLTTTTSTSGEPVETPIITKKRFSTMVEEKVRDLRVAYIEAVLIVCEERELPPEDIKRLLSPVIIDKIEAEALEVNSIKGGGARLPI